MLGTRVIPTTWSAPPGTIKTTFVVFVYLTLHPPPCSEFLKLCQEMDFLGLAGSNVRGKTYNPLPVPSWFPVIRKRNDEMSMKTFFAETKLFLQGENVEQTSCDFFDGSLTNKSQLVLHQKDSHAD